MKLIVLSDYQSRLGQYSEGHEIDVSEELAAHLMADAPGCFKEKPKRRRKAMNKPPTDKAIKAPEESK